MSTFAFASLTNTRERSAPGTTGVSKYIDTVTALVPAEILALHAAVLSLTTTTQEDSAGKAVTTITDPGILKVAFFVLAAFASLVYLFGHRGKWDKGDTLRAVVPAFAFVGWTMLQKSTAFDALAPGMSGGSRMFIALILAFFLGLVAEKMAERADESDPAAASRQNTAPKEPSHTSSAPRPL